MSDESDEGESSRQTYLQYGHWLSYERRARLERSSLVRELGRVVSHYHEMRHSCHIRRCIVEHPLDTPVVTW